MYIYIHKCTLISLILNAHKYRVVLGFIDESRSQKYLHPYIQICTYTYTWTYMYIYIHKCTLISLILNAHKYRVVLGFIDESRSQKYLHPYIQICTYAYTWTYMYIYIHKCTLISLILNAHKYRVVLGFTDESRSSKYLHFHGVCNAIIEKDGRK
jgi:hypothetical protein